MAVLVDEYRDHDSGLVDGVKRQAELLQRWWGASDLGDRRFTLEKPACSLRNRHDLEVFVRDRDLRGGNTADALFVYVTGHGITGASGSHFLQLHDTDPQRQLATAYRTSDLVAAALDSHAEHVLIIINTCDARGIDIDLAAALRELTQRRKTNASLAVLATADFNQPVAVGQLAVLLEHTHELLRTNSGYAKPYLSLEDFFTELERAIAEHHLDKAVYLPKVLLGEDRRKPHLCLPNPGYHLVPSARRQVALNSTDLDPDYWLDRASGRTSGTDPGWYFSGRRQLTTTVADFLRDGPPPGHSPSLVLTGAAGTGKSAVLARAVTFSDPLFLANPAYRAATEAAHAETLPPPRSVDAAVHARKRSAVDVLGLLCQALDLPVPPVTRGTDPALLRRQLAEYIGEQAPREVTLVIDGIDEGTDPSSHVSEVITPLAQLATPPRLLIGIRSPRPAAGSTAATPSSQGSAPSLLGELVRVLTRGEQRPTVHRTDGPEISDDIAHYLSALLAGPETTPSEIQAEVAALTTHLPEATFLDARLAGGQLREAPDRHRRIHDPAWLTALQSGTVGLLRQDLIDAAADDLDPGTALVLLRASALAQGAGVPWADIWPAIAEAVADRELPSADRAITALLRSRLAGYLAQDIEDERIVYRPVHDRLAQVLRDQPDLLHQDQEPRP